VKVEVPLNTEDFSIPPIKFTAKDKLLIICSPNNPNGDSVPLKKIEELCQSFPGAVFVDEAYSDFAEESALSLVPKYANLIVGRTYSKSSSLASIRLGFAIAHEEIIKLFNTVRLPYNVSYLTQVAGIATMRMWDEIQKRSEKIKVERTRVIQGLKTLGYNILPTQANFYVVKCASESAAGQIYNALKDRKILVRYWSKPGLAQYLRVTVGSSAQNDKFLAAMKDLKPLNK
jgi:histidinol-phosphate aminotransferase